MDTLPRAFPSTVSTTDLSCHVILKIMRDINRERVGTSKQVPCLTTIIGERTGVCVELGIDSGNKLFSTRYVELSDCYLIRINPKIFSFPERIKQVSHEILAMMRRGVKEWVEKDPTTGIVIRRCRNAYGLEPDNKKKSARYHHWVQNRESLIKKRRDKRKQEREHNSVAHC